MNKTLVSILTFLVAATCGVSVHAQQSGPRAAPVDFRACDYQSGKGAKDLQKVVERFRTYANENKFNYAAWIMVPQFQNGQNYDVGWLGAWPNSEAFGVSMERWMSEGAEMAAAFDAVLDCSARHEMALWVPINAPRSTPESGVLMISQCTLHDGQSTEDAYRAHVEMGDHMRGLGSMASSWLFYPMLGTGDIDYDYYHAVAFYRYSDMGAAIELYANGGGYKKARETVEKVAHCSAPTVFDVTSVRAFDE
ncbi:hypothetical protein F0M18_19800 [Pseudohalioglobus sediminis]|uniref:NIPSNAP protein n=1 Tax=Pseudohalioglobus sediminis TaxID=2606449 RepID=A0A5B0WKM6_9GAMM|nr:hypothetical protein [Pseudohalioglobus sediminis]KAA1187650.1 hypothetical protein F0M18_19800 [Pseudohalioglobus sediminis]